MPTLFKLLPKAVFLISFVFCSAFVFAEDITITTYYPSPYGVYNTLRLYPNDNAAAGDACANAGEMFYNQTSNQVLVCNGGTSKWQSIAGGIGGSVLYVYTAASCPSGWTNAGLFVSSGADHNVCYRTDTQCQVLYTYIAASCPSGWTNAGLFVSSGADHNVCYRCF